MITIGGLDSINITDSCDWEYMSVAIYNLTGDNSNSWGSVYTANAVAYGVSQAIYNVIGGDSSGKATKLLPDSGWSNSEVANLFTGTTNQSQPVVISSSTMATGTSQSSKVSAAAIAGGVVGGLAGVALIGTGILLLRRTLQKKKKAAKENGENYYTKPELEAKNPEPQPQLRRYELGEQYAVHEIDGIERHETWAGHPPVEMQGSEVRRKDLDRFDEDQILKVM